MLDCIACRRHVTSVQKTQTFCVLLLQIKPTLRHLQLQPPSPYAVTPTVTVFAVNSIVGYICSAAMSDGNNFAALRVHILPRHPLQASVIYAVAALSVCPTVCLTHSQTVWKWLIAPQNYCQRLLSPLFSFSHIKHHGRNFDEVAYKNAKCSRGTKN